jgi:hypothetical protein
MASDRVEQARDEYTVRRVGWVGIDGPYEVIGPVIPGGWHVFPAFGPVRWTAHTWTLWGAKRAIRNHKRAQQVIYRETA